MRVILGILSLVMVLALVAGLSKQQLKAVNGLPAAASTVLPGADNAAPSSNPQQQAMQIQQQIKAALDAAAQPLRSPADEKP